MRGVRQLETVQTHKATGQFSPFVESKSGIVSEENLIGASERSLNFGDGDAASSLH